MTTIRQDALPVISSRTPPGSFGLPLIGETLSFLIDPDFLTRRQQQHGSIFRTHIMGRPTVVMIGHEANGFILSTGMRHFSWGAGWPQTFKELLGDSLFAQDGAPHQHNRQLLMPAFHREALDNYLSTMESITETYLRRWELLGKFPWYEQHKQLTFAIASRLLIGTSTGEQTRRLSRLFTTMTNGLVTLPVRVPFMAYNRALRARDELLQFIETAARDRQKNPTTDALSLLIQSRDENGDCLSQKELVAQALLLLFAGHETTTSMLTSFCLVLARHPAVWARARAEQDWLAIKGRLTLEHLKQMPYLEQIFREVERMYAPIPGGFRGVVEPFEFNGFHVPAGWMALYSIQGSHYDSRIFPQPDVFDPDRFTPDRAEDTKQPFSLVGFGGGPRICLGYDFAQMEMKIIASKLLREYTWEVLPNQDTDFVVFPTLRPRDGLRVLYTRIKT